MKLHAPRWRSLAPVELAIIAVLAGLVLYLLIVAVRLRVDYFDAYQNLMNARTIVHAGQGDYTIVRHIVFPLLLTPILMMDAVGRMELAEFTAAHILAVILFTLLLYVAFRLFRLYLPRLWSLVGVLLLSWNLLLINNAPLTKEDIPGTLFTAAAFFFYLRARATGRWRDFLLAGTLMGAAIGTRYNLAPLLPAVILSYEIAVVIRARAIGVPWFPGRHVVLMKGIGLVALPIIILFLAPTIVYPVIGHSTIVGAPAQFLKDVPLVAEKASAANWQDYEDPVRNYHFLVESLTWPLALAAILGALESLRSRQPGSLFFFLWFAIIFVGATYLIAHKEARFLFPALPPLYFFAARGLQGLAKLAQDVSGRASRSSRLATRTTLAVVVAAVLLLPAWNATTALAKFSDPVYGSDFEAQVGWSAARLAGNAPIYWVGPAYPLHPQSYVFDREDPYTYLYHDFAHVAEFWADRPVSWLPGAQVLGTTAAGSLLVVLESGDALPDGSVLIINQEPQSYETATLPGSLKPLVVEQVRAAYYAPSATLASTGQTLTTGRTFKSETEPGLLRVTRPGSRVDVAGDGLPDGEFQLYAGDASNPLHQVATIIVAGGHFDAGVPGTIWPRGSEQELVVLSFGVPLPFPSLARTPDGG